MFGEVGQGWGMVATSTIVVDFRHLYPPTMHQSTEIVACWKAYRKVSDGAAVLIELEV